MIFTLSAFCVIMNTENKKGELNMIIPNIEHIQLYLNLFDKNIQLDILQEECAELIQAISKIKRKGLSKTRNNLIEEISHVLISLNMICEIYCITNEEIASEFNKKYDIYRGE